MPESFALLSAGLNIFSSLISFWMWFSKESCVSYDTTKERQLIVKEIKLSIITSYLAYVYFVLNNRSLIVGNACIISFIWIPNQSVFLFFDMIQTNQASLFYSSAREINSFNYLDFILRWVYPELFVPIHLLISTRGMKTESLLMMAWKEWFLPMIKLWKKGVLLLDTKYKDGNVRFKDIWWSIMSGHRLMFFK